MENINLIRKIAWSFHTTTGLEWDDLFQEAALAYLQALKSYDPDKGKITTYMWWCMSSHLKNYLKQHEKYHGVVCPMNGFDLPVSVEDPFEMISEEAQMVVRKIINQFDKYSMLTPKQAKQEVAREMIEEEEWTWKKLWVNIHDLKEAFSY